MSARFETGSRVRARVVNPSGHTRLPAYVRGRVGVVEAVRGDFSLPDAIVAGEPDPQPQAVYAVRFDVTELWGPDAEPGSEVAMDLWEDYLEPADEPVTATAGGSA